MQLDDNFCSINCVNISEHVISALTHSLQFSAISDARINCQILFSLTIEPSSNTKLQDGLKTSDELSVNQNKNDFIVICSVLIIWALIKHHYCSSSPQLD